MLFGFSLLGRPFLSAEARTCQFLACDKSRIGLIFPRKSGCRQFNSMKTAVKNLIWAAIYSRKSLNSFFLHFRGAFDWRSVILILHTARRRSDHFRLTYGILSFFRRPVGNRLFFSLKWSDTHKKLLRRNQLCAYVNDFWFLHVFMLSAAEGFPNWDELK